jgi:RNA polymerase sigma factor (sigma-70 family)
MNKSEEHTQLDALARKAKHGDPQALERLLCDKNIKKVIYRIANEHVGPENADAVYHEVRVRIFKSNHGWQEKAMITTWVGKITKNLCIDFLNKKNRERILITNVSHDALQGTVDANQFNTIAAKELLTIITEDFFPNMKGRCQQLLELLVFEELEKEEVEKIVNLKRSSLNEQWRKCRELLLKKIRNLEKKQQQKRS